MALAAWVTWRSFSRLFPHRSPPRHACHLRRSNLGVNARVAAEVTTAPATESARAASESVAPVVRTSSTSSTRLPSRRRVAASAPTRFAALSSTSRAFCAPDSRVFSSAATRRYPAFLSSIPTGSKPRRENAPRLVGTVMIRSAVDSRGAMDAARARPSDRAISVRPCSLNARMALLASSSYRNALSTSTLPTRCWVTRGVRRSRHDPQRDRSGAPHPAHSTGRSKAHASRRESTITRPVWA